MIKKLKYVYDHFEEYFLVLTLSVSIVIIFIQVIMRYVFNNSLSWSEEAARFLFIWFSWLGISLGQKRGEHIKVTVLTDRFANMPKRTVSIVADVITLCILALLVKTGFSFMHSTFDIGSLSPAMRFPMWIIFLACPIGSFIMGIRVVAELVRKVKDPDWEAHLERQYKIERGEDPDEDPYAEGVVAK